MAALLFGVPASAQITVSKSGQTHLGTFQEWASLTPLSTATGGSPGLGGGDIYIPSTNDSRIDTAANLCSFSSGIITLTAKEIVFEKGVRIE